MRDSYAVAINSIGKITANPDQFKNRVFTNIEDIKNIINPGKGKKRGDPKEPKIK
jgi:hypothetical protein